MADITTNTLKIGNNNLILRDADAQAKIVTNTQDISGLKEDLSEVQTDVYGTSNYTTGYKMSNSGSIAEAEGLCVSGKVYVPSSTSITVYGGAYADDNIYACEFNASDQFVDYWGLGHNKSRTFTTSANTSYIRLTFVEGFNAYVYANNAVIWEATTTGGIQSVVNNLSSEVTTLNTDLNLVNDGYYSFDLIADKRILRDNGAEANYTGWSATDYIPVPANSVVIYEGNFNMVWGALYDSEKQYISVHSWDTQYVTYFNDTGSLVYFRTSEATANISTVKFRILNIVDTTLSKIGYPAEAKTVGDELTSVKTRVSALENADTNTDAIPSYYETQLATKETSIRGHFDDCAYNGDGLVFLTDTHFSADLFTSDTPTSLINANNSFTLIKDVIDKTGIDKIVFGGDLVNSATDIDTMLLSMASFQTKFGNRQSRLRYCVGNHEYFTGSDLGQTTKPTPSDLYGAGIKYNEDVVLAKGDMDTYYFDNDVQKIRYFVVSCGRDTETSVAQVKWVLEQFEDVPEGYKVICIGHGFMADNMVAFRGGYKPIADALDAVKVGGSYTYVYGTNLSETYDYSALVDVTPVCMITGHTHIDGSLTTSGGIPCICTTTDSYAQNYELVDGTPTKTPRTKGTTDEQAFDVFQFDFTNRKIYATRIGYGSDREFSY